MGAIAAVALASFIYITDFQTNTKDKNEKSKVYRMLEGENNELLDCSKQRMINILEDLRIKYTPYYTHFYHMLVALESEYAEKPVLKKKLREKIQDILEKKVAEI